MSGALAVGSIAGLSVAVAAICGAGSSAQAFFFLCSGSLALFAVISARSRRRRRKWKEVERLSRCMFAAAGHRRRWRPS